MECIDGILLLAKRDEQIEYLINEILKVCLKCEEELPLFEFDANKSRKDGLSLFCKNCKREWLRASEYYFSDEYKKSLKKAQKRWITFSGGKKYHTEYIKNRRKEDPIFDLNYRIRSAVSVALRRRSIPKNNRAWSLLPFSLEDLVSHLKSKFTEGMSWDNRSLWHIDHKRPISSFNFDANDIENCPEFKECWSLENLQPLWAEDNFSKGAKWKEEKNNASERS